MKQRQGVIIFLFFFCSIGVFGAIPKQITDSIIVIAKQYEVYDTTYTLIGKRIYPESNSDSIRTECYQNGVYCCLEQQDTLIIITDNTDIEINNSLQSGKHLLCNYYKYNREAEIHFMSSEGDMEIIGYSDFDTLCYSHICCEEANELYNDSSLTDIERREILDKNYFLYSCKIQNPRFNYGKIKIGMKQKSILGLLGLKLYKKEYTHFIVIHPKMIKQMWYFNNEHFKTKYKSHNNPYRTIIELLFEKKRLTFINYKGIFNFDENHFFIPGHQIYRNKGAFYYYPDGCDCLKCNELYHD